MKKATIIVSVSALLMLLWTVAPTFARIENQSASALLYSPGSDMYLFVSFSRTSTAEDQHTYYIYLMIPDGGDLSKPLWSEGQYSDSASWKSTAAWATGTVTYQSATITFSATWKATTHKPTTTELDDGVINISRDALATATFGTMNFVQEDPLDLCSAVIYKEWVPPGY